MLSSGSFWVGLIVGIALYYGFLWWRNRQAKQA